jgi:NADPH2:quinone reductase
VSKDNRQVIYQTFGDSSVLQLQLAKIPIPSAGHVVIKMAGAGLNPIDYKTRLGLGFVAAQIKDTLPWSPGYDLSGNVVAVADDVDCWQAGDKVFGMIGFPLQGGACADYVQVRADVLVAAPENIPLSDCGAVPLAALTAWQSLFDAGNLHPESRVLIHAAAGGVGHFAVQFAKARQCYVIATASAKNHDFLRSLGVDEVIDYQQQDFTKQCTDIDFVLDSMGGDIGLKSIGVLAQYGQLVTVPTNTAQQIIDAGHRQHCNVKGMTVQVNVAQLQEIAALIRSGKVIVSVSQRVSLENIATGHDLLESGHTRGKLVVVP